MIDLAKKSVTKKTAKKTTKKAPAKPRAAATPPAEKPAKASKPAAQPAKPARKTTAAKKTEPKAAPAAPKAKQTKKPAKAAEAKAKPEVKAEAAEKKSKAKTPAPKKPAAKAEPKAAPKPPAKPARAEPKTDTPEAAPAKDGADKKAPRKGITVVEPTKKAPAKPKPASKYNPPVRPMLLGPGSTFNKPLIPSGPSAPKPTSIFDAPRSKRTKTPLTKAKLDRYRALLLAKRAELFGDLESMENEALRSGSGGLSNTPQHLAEQGSESYDQSLSLNLAAQDRRVIREIDEALKRIDDGTYGLCELTNQPISEERLDEIPWARYTIEAARQIEARGGNPATFLGGYAP